MANFVYPTAKAAMLSGQIDLTTDTVKVALQGMGTAGTFPEFLSELGGYRVTSPALTGKTVAGGVFDADDVTLPAVAAPTDQFDDPVPFSAIVVYVDGGTDATSRVIARLDTATGLPFTADGSDVTITWDSGASRIFAL